MFNLYCLYPKLCVCVWGNLGDMLFTAYVCCCIFLGIKFIQQLAFFLFVHYWLYKYKMNMLMIEKECNFKLIYACYLMLAQLLPFLINDWWSCYSVLWTPVDVLKIHKTNVPRWIKNNCHLYQRRDMHLLGKKN